MAKEKTPEELEAEREQEEFKEVLEKHGLDPEDSDVRQAVAIRRAARELDERAAHRREETSRSKKKTGLFR